MYDWYSLTSSVLASILLVVSLTASTICRDATSRPVDLSQFHDSSPQFIAVYKALPEHLFAFTFAVYSTAQ